MTLLSKNINRTDKDAKFVGVHLPLQTNSYLTMYAIATKISKSSIICAKMEEWKQGQEQLMTLDEMIDIITTRAVESYKITKKRQSDFHAGIFFDRLKKELIKKGIDSIIVSKILKKVKDAKK